MGKKPVDDTMLKVWFAIDENVPKTIQSISKETKVSWDAVNSYCFLFWHMGIVIILELDKNYFVKIPNTIRLQVRAERK